MWAYYPALQRCLPAIWDQQSLGQRQEPAQRAKRRQTVAIALHRPPTRSPGPRELSQLRSTPNFSTKLAKATAVGSPHNSFAYH